MQEIKVLFTTSALRSTVTILFMTKGEWCLEIGGGGNFQRSGYGGSFSNIVELGEGVIHREKSRAFRDKIPIEILVAITWKWAMKKRKSDTKPITTLPNIYRATFYFLQERGIILKDMLVKATIFGQHTVSRRYRCTACHPLQFFTKKN